MRGIVKELGSKNNMGRLKMMGYENEKGLENQMKIVKVDKNNKRRMGKVMGCKNER